MATKSTRCPVLGARVMQVTDLTGRVTRIVCAAYVANGMCRLKESSAGAGPLAQLLERVADGAPASRGAARIFCSR